jgi:hypothetical protein
LTAMKREIFWFSMIQKCYHGQLAMLSKTGFFFNAVKLACVYHWQCHGVRQITVKVSPLDRVMECYHLSRSLITPLITAEKSLADNVLYLLHCVIWWLHSTVNCTIREIRIQIYLSFRPD